MNKEGTDRIITAGWIRGGKHQQDQIIHMEGIGKCFTAGSHLNADWMFLFLEVKYDD
jgi:hypothetical protein